ncbi:BTAD domain-containing putative transcriptional regulator [Nocardiopsis sediminis]|uniref:BTAD domain-containing putative transcriptional regulator n=1 Tax=Nocardiopsis sediminis TaxID=1778267 RepID=A0ABV8FUT3_9ACTN
MEFGVLGPISAWSDGVTIPVGGPRQRCVLGVLLVDLGKEVTVERLIEYLWDDDPPRTARSVIQVQISHLRRAFPDVIQTTAGGYMAQVEADRVDLHRFRRLVAEAQRAQRPADALPLWDRALACWRGQPFSGTGSDQLWYAVSQPLLEERWAAIVAWAECAFSLFRYSEIVTRLTPLVREEPLRERLQYLLIAALHRSGQRAAALNVFHETRSYLAKELGVDPSPEVMELYQRILQDSDVVSGEPQSYFNDDSTHSDPASGGAFSEGVAPDFQTRNDLPRDIPDFTGREDDLRALLRIGGQAAERAEVAVITGPGGAGKTTLAIHAAHKLAANYPDGQLFIDLYGYTVDREPLAALGALGALLRAVGAETENLPESLEERSALWRSMIVGKRLLVVLDNAVNFAQVNPLLPAAPGSMTLVTTRNDLPGVSGARYFSLDMLSAETSLQLFATVLGAERVEREQEQAQEVARLCGGLPLALRIVVGRMLSRPRWTFAHVAQRLGEQQRRFRELRIDGQSVEAVFELSYQSLNTVQSTTFMLLGMMIGSSIDLHGAAALLGVDPPTADDLLQELVSVRLLDESGVDLYRFHDLIGAYSRQKALADMPADETDAARLRLADHYLDMADRAADLLGPRGHEYEVTAHGASRYRRELTNNSEAVSWFRRHQENLAPTVDFYAALGDGEKAWQLADSLWGFYASHGQTELLVAIQERALSINRAQRNDRGSAVTLIGLGITHCLAGRFELSLKLLNEARDILKVVTDPRGEARVAGNLGVVYERMGRFHDALDCFHQVLDYALSVGDVQLSAIQRNNIGMLHLTLGDLPKVVEFSEAALQTELGDGMPRIAAISLRQLGEASAQQGDFAGAFKKLGDALYYAQLTESPQQQIFIYNALGVAQRGSGDTEAAVASHMRALEVGEETAQSSGDAEILVELGITYTKAGEHQQALAALERARTLAVERSERYMEARALLALGQLPHGTIDRATAMADLSASATIFGELRVPLADEAQAALDRIRDDT